MIKFCHQPLSFWSISSTRQRHTITVGQSTIRTYDTSNLDKSDVGNLICSHKYSSHWNLLTFPLFVSFAVNLFIFIWCKWVSRNRHFNNYFEAYRICTHRSEYGLIEMLCDGILNGITTTTMLFSLYSHLTKHFMVVRCTLYIFYIDINYSNRS